MYGTAVHNTPELWWVGIHDAHASRPPAPEEHGSPPRLVGARRLREEPRGPRRAGWFVGGEPVESMAPAVLRRGVRVLRRGVPVP